LSRTRIDCTGVLPRSCIVALFRSLGRERTRHEDCFVRVAAREVPYAPTARLAKPATNGSKLDANPSSRRRLFWSLSPVLHPGLRGSLGARLRRHLRKLCGHCRRYRAFLGGSEGAWVSNDEGSSLAGTTGGSVGAIWRSTMCSWETRSLIIIPTSFVRSPTRRFVGDLERDSRGTSTGDLADCWLGDSVGRGAVGSRRNGASLRRFATVASGSSVQSRAVGE
jgi:hypothetical protein